MLLFIYLFVHVCVMLQFVEGQLGRNILKQSLAQLREVQQEADEEMEGGHFLTPDHPVPRDNKR